MALVSLEHVSRQYRLGSQTLPALRDVILDIAEGVFLAIGHLSGSGKSTLLNLIACIDAPTAGRLLIDGRDVCGHTPDQLADCRARTVGSIFQARRPCRPMRRMPPPEPMAPWGRRLETPRPMKASTLESRSPKMLRRVAQALALSTMCSGTAAQAQGTDGASIDAGSARWQGWLQFGSAYTYASPSHWSQLRGRAEIAGTGDLGGGVKWKLSARAGYDAVYDGTDFYPDAVRRDQRTELMLREAYVDFSQGDWEFRMGKQDIVWGEMVGLFFADVVSAKDYREFVLPEFAQIRIPQWAARAEWYGKDAHVELVWLPAPATNRIGEPGAEFFPYPPPVPGLGYQIEGEERPSRKFSNGGFGVRGSTLAAGWDLAAFAYRSIDSGATFYRTILDAPQATAVFRPRFDRVSRLGGTLAKDFDGVVVKVEAVYTDGRKFNSASPDAPDGLVPLRTLDWIAGVDLTPGDGWRVNGQLFYRLFVDYDASIGLRRHEFGASVLVSHDFGNGLEAEMLAISSLVRADWMLRPALVWKAGPNSRVRMGVDVFGGWQYGLFGQYANRDRAYAEYRYSF